MTVEEFLIFREFMISVNTKSKKMETSCLKILGKNVSLVKDTEIEGLKFVWDIFLNCKTEEVIPYLTKFMKDLFLNNSNQMLAAIQVSRVEELLKKLDKFIKDGVRKSNTRIIKNSLMLLRRIINDLKEQFTLQYDYHQYLAMHNFKYELQTYESQTCMKKV